MNLTESITVPFRVSPLPGGGKESFPAMTAALRSGWQPSAGLTRYHHPGTRRLPAAASTHLMTPIDPRVNDNSQISYGQSFIVYLF